MDSVQGKRRKHNEGGRGFDYSPWEEASLIAKITFSYAAPLLDRGREQALVDEDLDMLARRDSAEEVVTNLEMAWNYEKQQYPDNPSLWKALFWSPTNTIPIFCSGLFAAMESSTRISQPVVMGFLVEWLAQGGAQEKGYGEGVKWALILIGIGFVQAIVHHQLYFFTMRGGWNCKVAAKGLIQRKLLRLSLGTQMASNSIINLVSNDVLRFEQFCMRGHFGWTAPIEVIVIFLIMWTQLGIFPALAGIGVVVATLPLQIYFGRRFAIQRKVTAGVTDQRVRKTAEIFTGIGTVKSYCWEVPFTDQISTLRGEERASIFISQRMKAYNITFYLVTPALASLLTFAVFWAQGQELEVSKVFSVIALLQVLRVSIGKQFAGFIEAFPECLVAASRIRAFLLQPETNTERYNRSNDDNNNNNNNDDGHSSKEYPNMIELKERGGQRSSESHIGSVGAPAAAAGGGGLFRGSSVYEGEGGSTSKMATTTKASASTTGTGVEGPRASSTVELLDHHQRPFSGSIAAETPSSFDISPIRIGQDCPVLELKRATFAFFRNEGGEEEGPSPSAKGGREEEEKGSPNDDSRSPRPFSAPPPPRVEGKKEGKFGEEEAGEEKEKQLKEGRALAVRDIDLTLKSGELLMIAGPVGAGKSSLLHGILGELSLTKGSVKRDPSVCICGQNGWIMATNLRENVLFGRPMDRELYNEVIRVCGLQKDLLQLPNGDLTQLGERGVNLSGGQKARVALARACYSGRRICLLDDPLSAVDPHVMQQLFDECIEGFLIKRQRRAVVLVTHHVHYAARATTLLLLGADGSSLYYGSPLQSEAKDLLKLAAVGNDDDDDDDDGDDEKGGGEKKGGARGSGDAQQHAAIAEMKEEEEEKVGRGGTEEKEGEDDKKEEEKKEQKKKKSVTVFIRKEERETGSVLWSTYTRYAAMSGWGAVGVCLFLFVLAQGSVLVGEFWLKIWAEQDRDRQRNPLFLYVFIGIIAFVCVVATIRSVLFYEVNLRGASELHDRSFLRVLRSPMTFFHQNPLGRVLNKFSSDLGQIDELLPVVLFDVIQLSLTSLAAFIVVCIAIPWMALLSMPLVASFIMLRSRFLETSRELKRLESINKSPLFAAFTAQLRGLVAIRAFGAERRLRNEFVEKLDRYGRAWFSWLLANRWIGFRLDMLSFTVLVCASLGAVATSNTIDPGLAGIALTYAIMLSGGFQYLVRQSAKAETMMTSVERMLHYTTLPSEGAWNRADRDRGGGKGEKEKNTRQQRETDAAFDSAPKGWPQRGLLELVNVRARYREDLPLVLKGLSFTAQPGAKVGIVGRTGSGKSSLLNALLRLCQVEEDSIIRLDGVNTLDIGLHTLRSKIAWIPQEPHLFSGTLRENLDPFNRRPDKEIWRALRSVHLGASVEGMPGGLSTTVTDGGSNLSVGQRQLLSLARATLAGARVVVMDEATANIDLETDKQIQASIQEAGSALEGCTVLMIAHRMRTVIGCDMVVVLDAGRVIEVGAPQVLVKKPDGIFASMVRASGLLSELSSPAKGAVVCDDEEKCYRV